MAGIWSISPDYEPSIINKDTGEVKFPPNDSNDEKSYTIKYVDEELGIECTRAIVQEGKGCKFTYNPQSSISSDGGEITLGTFTDYNDDALRAATVQVTEDNDNVVTSIDIIVSNHTVVGNIKKNEDSRTKTFKYVIKSGNDSECATATVTQSKGCECDNLSVDKTSLTWDYGDSSPKDIIVTSSSCVTNISIPSGTEHYIITTTPGKITVRPRNASLVSDDTFSITYLRDCDITISLKQNAQVFDCNDISVMDGALSNYRFTLKEFNIPGNIDLGWVVAPLSITTTAEFKQHIPEDSLRAEDAVVVWDDWAGGHDGQPLRRCIVVKRINEVDSPRISNVYVTIDGHECAVFQFLRTCPCAMDNCYPTDLDEGSGKYDYPLPITSYPSQATITVTDAYGNPFVCNCLAHTADYICLDDVTNLYYVDEENNEHQVWGSGGLYVDIAGFVPNVPGYEYNGFNETTSQGLQMFYYEAGHQIFYVCPPNLTYVRKDYTVKFRVKNGARISCNDKYGWYGEKACEEFIVHLYQAPCGGSYEHHYRDEQGIDHKICTAKDPYTGENKRVLVRKRTGRNPYEGNLIPCPFLPMDNQPVWCDENHVCEEKPWQQRVDNTGTCVPT